MGGLLLLVLAGCAPAPPPPVEQPKLEQVKPDVTTESWYAPATDQLAAMSRDADSLWKGGRSAAAARIVTDSQPLMNRLLAAPRPTLAAMEVASDLDQLYGRMLLDDHRYGWARMQFQKNVIRWKNWQPQSGETRRRLQLATSAIAECDRRLAEK
jgi:hypothetical protein